MAGHLPNLEASHHCRRYEMGELKSKLVGTGYRLEYITYYMASIFPWYGWADG